MADPPALAASPRWAPLPNLAGVLGDGAIRREFAAGRNVVDGHLQPLGLVLQIRQKYRGLNNDRCYLFF